MDNSMPEKACQTTQANPWSVERAVSAFADAVGKWPDLWMEGQISQISVRQSGAHMSLKDLRSEISIQVKAFGKARGECVGLEQGERVAVFCRPNLWKAQASFSVIAQAVRRTGMGNLIDQVNALRARLASEGLFDASRKVKMPSFPKKIGIICGQGARAENDIIANSRLRWPNLEFTVEHALVQGPHCPQEVSAAIRKLDSMGLDVLVVARGGGAYEDLVGFSSEQVVRAAAECVTPIVSAIGHEDDWTLIDLAADLRCSTPTGVAKDIIPDFLQEKEVVENASAKLSKLLESELFKEETRIARLSLNSSMQDPRRLVLERFQELEDEEKSLNLSLSMYLDFEYSKIVGLSASVKALSPASTLSRGYALVEKQGKVLAGTKGMREGDLLEIVMRDGRAKLRVEGMEAG